MEVQLPHEVVEGLPTALKSGGFGLSGHLPRAVPGQGTVFQKPRQKLLQLRLLVFSLSFVTLLRQHFIKF